MPNAHDQGENPADESIDQTEHEFADWENRTHVMVEALREEGIIYTEELRAGIDALPSDLQESLSYYETWSASVWWSSRRRGTRTATRPIWPVA